MHFLTSIAHRFNRGSLQRYVRRHYEKIYKKALADAHSMAIRQELNEDLLKQYAEGLKATFQSLLLYVLQKLEAGMVDTDIGQEEKKVKEKSIQNEKIIKKLSNEREVIETDRRRLDETYNWFWYRFKLVALPILVLGEVALNTTAFQILGEVLILNVICSFCFSLCLALASHYFPKIIQAAEGDRNKKIRAAGIGAGAFIVFLVLGWLRAKVVLNNFPDSMHGNDFLYTILAFAIINFFFFICLMVFSWLGLPSKEQWLTKEKLKKLNKELALVNRKIAEAENDTKTAFQNLEILQKQVKEKEALKQWIEGLTVNTILDFTNEVSLKRIPLHSLNSNNSLKPKQ